LRTRGRGLFRGARACLAVLALAAGGAAALAQSAPDVTLQPYIGSLTYPLGFVNAGDGSSRTFVITQFGKIFVYQGETGLGTFLDVSGLLPCGDPSAGGCGEQGLLGLAFHPKYATNGLFFIDYTNTDGDEVIARYKVSSDANVANPASATILLVVPDPFPNHNGGQLQFGPDGYLYIAMGDGGSGGDPGNRSQNKGVLLGKILRIDVDGSGTIPCGQVAPGPPYAPYGIPADNPFVGTTGDCAEVWAYGLRNPWRFSFDRENGDLFIGDVGQNLYEEIDYQPAGIPGGRNYGWRRMEGFHCYDPATNCDDGTLTLPILEHDHSLGCSVTGGYVYRGVAYPQLNGVYVYGDYCTGTIWGAVRDAAGSWSKQVIATSQFISSFGEDEAGELYVVEHSGSVKRITSVTSYLKPSLAALAPGAAVKGDPGILLTVDGSGFTPSSVVRWNGAVRTTTYVSRTRLQAAIPAADVAGPGTALVAVANPAPGGGVSAAMTFQITNRFLDVPAAYPLRRPIEGIAAAGITTGCGDRIFCPESPLTRDQLAVLLLRGEHGSSYAPPAANGTIFSDVSKTTFAAAFIERLSAEGITTGCGMGNYCPAVPVTRAPMAKFLLRAHDGSSYQPPPAQGVFTDVPASSPFAAWIEELSARGITTGCGGGKFCPNSTVTRAQMAAFLARTFSISLPP
jgi:glucose/arabinose dehydrogenase